MFYSETLLAKTGPLARVWLASNVERKLTKSQILGSDIQSSVGAIVDTGQTPMALRLSGQLMLGVVRIYGRKARYLLDDCNETLVKIRMTFKNTTSNDLPQTTGVAADLNLPELLTVDDLFPTLEIPFPLSQAPNNAIDASFQDLGIDWTSSLNPHTNTQSRLSPDDQPLLNDQELDLDFGDDIGLPGHDTSISIEVGRGAAGEKSLGDDILGDDPLLNNDELPLDFGDVQMSDQPADDAYLPDAGDENPPPMLGFDDDETMQLRNATRPREGSLLSEPTSDVVAELDRTFADPGDVSELAVQQPQRTKKRKAVIPDAETILHLRQIKAQSEDRSKILRPLVFLPRDPLLMTLMNMQKHGDFVSSVMNDTRSRNWAPELRGLVSIDAFRRPTDRKRKRDSGIADVSDDDGHGEKSPRLELPEDGGEGFDIEDEGVAMADSGGLHDGELMLGDAHEEDLTPADEDGMFGVDAFDDTTIPLVHPADSGPVSVSTKRAVHLLRDQFDGLSVDGSPASQSRKSVLLQDLVPEHMTSKSDATKMFFEVLVLATKDAIKVEQAGNALGLPLRIRGKRGLWGSWAETTPANEATSTQTAAVAVGA